MTRWLTLALLLPGLAFAGATVNPSGLTAWDIYVMGNGQATATILMSIAAMVDMPGYHHLIQFAAIIGIIAMAVAAGFDPLARGPKLLMYIVLAGVVSSLGLNLRAQAMINDPITGYYSSVSAPAVVVIPVAMISSTGNWLTSAIEQSFGAFASYPDEMQMARGGRYGMAAGLLGDLHKYAIRDPWLRQTLSGYMSTCVVYGEAMGQMNAQKMMQSTDFWQQVKSNNPSIYTVVRLPPAPGADAELVKADGDVKPCSEAWSQIDAYLTAYVPELATGGGKAWSTTGAFTELSKQMSASSAWLAKGSDGSTGLDGGSMIKQAAMLNMWTDSNRDAAMQTGNGEMQTALAQAQAEQSQKSHWVVAAQLFQHTIGYVHMLLTSIVMALAPLFLVMLLIPGFGVKSLGSFLRVLIWLALWQPVLAILNYITAAYLQADMATVLNVGGVTMMNQAALTEFASHAQVAGGFLASMVPLFLWGLVNGGLAFTEFVSHGLGAQFATSAGAQAATGNVNLNNQSLNKAVFANHVAKPSYRAP